MKISGFIALLFTLVILIIGTHCCADTSFSTCRSLTFSDNTFTEKAASFSVYGKVYLRIHCHNLSPGEHQISTEWIDSEGGLQRADSHKFRLSKQQDYTCFFRFKLLPKGSLLQMASGRDFDDQQYGQWTVITYLDFSQIGRNEFSLND